MSISKFKGTTSLILLAWLNEFQNPDFFFEKHAEYIDPEIKMIRNILDAADKLDSLKRHSKSWGKSNTNLEKLLLAFAANEALPLTSEHYYPNEIWVKAGPKLALQLARAHSFRLSHEKVPKSVVKNLHHKRAFYFDAVKDTARILTEYLLEANERKEKLGGKIKLDFSDNYDVNFLLDTVDPLDRFIPDIKVPSDKEIFKTAKFMRTQEKYYVVKFADEIMEFSGFSNFKSMERSLALGRKSYQ